MSAISINTPIQEYMTRGGEPITLAEAEHILTEIEDVAFGMNYFCEAYLKSSGLTMEESALLTFLNLGVKRIAEGLCSTIPDAPKKQEADHE